MVEDTPGGPDRRRAGRGAVYGLAEASGARHAGADQQVCGRGPAWILAAALPAGKHRDRDCGQVRLGCVDRADHALLRPISRSGYSRAGDHPAGVYRREAFQNQGYRAGANLYRAPRIRAGYRTSCTRCPSFPTPWAAGCPPGCSSASAKSWGWRTPCIPSRQLSHAGHVYGVCGHLAQKRRNRDPRNAGADSHSRFRTASPTRNSYSAKAQLKGAFLLGLESSSGRMQSIGRSMLHLNYLRTPDEVLYKNRSRHENRPARYGGACARVGSERGDRRQGRAPDIKFYSVTNSAWSSFHSVRTSRKAITARQRIIANGSAGLILRQNPLWWTAAR